ncbi:restriction endonuclease subunit S [Lactococcus cremoris]|uniref:restriction endonuclease subunit S n=1 Tax=Lactococcus lactis subsp. cremoris TaxID=1359 RepID=UPI001AF56716|nr:restriction endonuclease subunit S [Lactococcus cremoris]QRZ33673.1 restriction endonuclease subunit S [Lactococcus cremoris]
MAKIDDSVKKKVPELRFPGFTDDWEERKLTDVTYSYSGLTYSPTDVQDKGTFVLRSSNVKNDQLIDADNVYVNPDIVNSNNVKVGDVIVVVRNGSRSLIGKHAIVTKEMPHTVIGAFMSAFRGENGDYINALLSTNNFQKEVHKSLGATINQITGKDFSMMNFLTPKLEEQNKIGSFFKQLDNTIALHQRKLDLLKEQKKGYLQKMFPKNGAKVPELRFAGFADDWEERKLGQYTKLITKGTTPKDKTGIGDVNFVKVENITNGKIYPINKIKQHEHDNYLKRSRLEEKDILFSIAGTLGRTAIVNKSILPANTNQALAIIRGYDFDTNFLITSLAGNVVEEYIRRNPTVGAQPNLSLEQVGNLLVNTPNAEEQQKIGSFFKQLDDTIALHQRKLDLLKEQKKGFLQKMFV